MKEAEFRLGFEITGILFTTNDIVEQQPTKALLPQAWQFFYEFFSPQSEQCCSSFAIYSYPNPLQPAYYQVCIGSKEPLQTDTYSNLLKTGRVSSGQYLLFQATGIYPDIVNSLWAEIEHYFMQPDCEYRRAYTTDYEEVLPTGQLVIAISVAAACQTLDI